MFAPDDQKPEKLEGILGVMKRFHGLIEKGLVHHGGKLAAGNHVTIADFVLASYVGNYLGNPYCPAQAGIDGVMDATP